jgi:hypothetical protein
MTTAFVTLDSVNDLWWRRVPAAAQRIAATLAAALTDGLYLAAWPLVGALVPPIAFILGIVLAAGWIPPLHGELFTYSIALIAIMTAVGSLGAAPGAWLWLGYVITDFFFVHREDSVYVKQVTLFDGTIKWLIATFIPYVLLAMLLVLIPLVTSRLRFGTLHRVYRRFKLPILIRAAADLVLQAALTGVLVYAWVEAVPTLIRPFYSLHNNNPPVAAIKPLQEPSSALILVLVAAALAAIRIVVEYLGDSMPAAVRRLSSLRASLATSAHTIRKPLPAWATAPFKAILMTILLAGLFETWTDAITFGLAVLVILLARWAFSTWVKIWPELLSRVPLLVRLAVWLLATYYLAQQIVGSEWANTDSFQPLVNSALLALAVFAVLVPDFPAQHQARTATTQIVPRSGGATT